MSLPPRINSPDLIWPLTHRNAAPPLSSLKPAKVATSGAISCPVKLSSIQCTKSTPTPPMSFPHHPISLSLTRLPSPRWPPRAGHASRRRSTSELLLLRRPLRRTPLITRMLMLSPFWSQLHPSAMATFHLHGRPPLAAARLLR